MIELWRNGVLLGYFRAPEGNGRDYAEYYNSNPNRIAYAIAV